MKNRTIGLNESNSDFRMLENGSILRQRYLPLVFGVME